MSEAHGSEEVKDLWQRGLVVDSVGTGVHVQGEILGREGGEEGGGGVREGGEEGGVGGRGGKERREGGGGGTEGKREGGMKEKWVGGIGRWEEKGKEKGGEGKKKGRRREGVWVGVEGRNSLH